MAASSTPSSESRPVRYIFTSPLETQGQVRRAQTSVTQTARETRQNETDTK